jgi:hypothetical protein
MPPPAPPQDVQRDLRAAQQQRELTEQEAAQLSAVNQRLSGENDALGAATTSLRAENEALMARADALLERQALLEQCAESLKLENSTLIGQFDRLKLKHEAEAAGFGEQLAELKAAVGGALSRFTAGDLSADQLVAFLSQMGVELRGRCVPVCQMLVPSASAAAAAAAAQCHAMAVPCCLRHLHPRLPLTPRHSCCASCPCLMSLLQQGGPQLPA